MRNWETFIYLEGVSGQLSGKSKKYVQCVFWKKLAEAEKRSMHGKDEIKSEKTCFVSVIAEKTRFVGGDSN